MYENKKADMDLNSTGKTITFPKFFSFTGQLALLGYWSTWWTLNRGFLALNFLELISRFWEKLSMP